jgi:uncharacterized protein YjiS (DUF1127 family)
MTRLTANELLMLRAAGPQAAQLIAFEQVMADSRRMRAEAAARTFAGVGRFAKRLAASLARASTRRRVLDQLHRLDDRMLRDIGLERTTLAEAVDATLESRAPAWAAESFSIAGSITGLGKALVAPIVRPIVRWHRQATTLGELAQLDDHLLADIGVSRGDLRYAPEAVMERAEAANRNEAQRAA